MWLNPGDVIDTAAPMSNAIGRDQLEARLLSLTKPQLIHMLDKHGLRISNRGGSNNAIVETFVRRWDLILQRVVEGSGKGVGKGHVQSGEP